MVKDYNVHVHTISTKYIKQSQKNVYIDKKSISIKCNKCAWSILSFF